MLPPPDAAVNEISPSLEGRVGASPPMTHQDQHEYNSFNNSNGGQQNHSNGVGNHLNGPTFNGPAYFAAADKPDNGEEKLLDSLAFQEMNDRFYGIDEAVPGTCEWLLNHGTYKRWSQDDCALLWIRGKPGSGKSTLMRFLLSSIEKQSTKKDQPLVLSYFFYDGGSELQKSSLGLYRSLFYQLLRKTPDLLHKLQVKHGQSLGSVGIHSGSWQWSYLQLKHLFRVSLMEVAETRPISLFIDALDECASQKEMESEPYQDFQSIIDVASTAKSKIQFTISCRRVPDFPQTCRPQIFVDKICVGKIFVGEIFVDEHNADDIRKFVEQELPLELTETSIPASITGRAQGVFEWVRLVLARINDLHIKGRAPGIIEDKINTIPSSLNDLYRSLVKKAEERQASLELFQVICFAVRPLSLGQVKWALQTDANRPPKSLKRLQQASDFICEDRTLGRRVQALGCGLVELKNVNDIQVVQFTHQSVRGFLLSEGLAALERPIWYMIEDLWEPAKDVLIKEASSTLMNTGLPVSSNLLQPAVMAMLVLALPILPELLGALSSVNFRLFLPLSIVLASSLVIWLQRDSLRNVYTNYSIGMAHARLSRVCLHFLAMEEFREMTLEDVFRLERDSKGHFLSYATTSWVAHSVQSDASTRPQEYLTKCFMDQSNGLLKQWLRFLRIFAGVSSYICPDNATTFLHIAARIGLSGLLSDILSQTDLNDANIEAKDSWGRTALLCAAEGGHETIVRLLLEKGANIEATDNWGRTPLWYAAAAHDYFTPALSNISQHSAAATARYGAVVRLLLQYGANVNAKDRRKSTPLLAAAAGVFSLAQVIEDRGDPVGDEIRNARNKQFHSGECAISENEWKDFLLEAEHKRLTLLASQEKQTRSTSRLGTTHVEYEAVIKLLVDRAPDVEAKDDSGMTALLYEDQRRSEDGAVAQLLRSARSTPIGQSNREIQDPYIHREHDAQASSPSTLG